MSVNKEILYHMQCGQCKGYFSLSDGIKEPAIYWCPHCGELQIFNSEKDKGENNE